MSGFLIQTYAKMWRAEPDARYPWTSDKDSARRFKSIAKARQAIADHAAFTERAMTDYRLWHELPDGSLDAEPVGDPFESMSADANLYFARYPDTSE